MPAPNAGDPSLTIGPEAARQRAGTPTEQPEIRPPGPINGNLVTLPPGPAVDATAALAPAGLPDSGGSVAQVPGYEILGKLGEGGMGVVYKARHLQLNRIVALKMILSGGHARAADIARFRTEAEAIARLQHPNIVQVYEVGQHDGTPFLALEFCAGGSLDRKLDGTPLPAQEAARLLQVLAGAMQAAHDKNVIHRDLKPANVLLAEDGTPKITDFGLAKKLDDVGQTASGVIMGTPSYMAPEQAGSASTGRIPVASVVGTACDIYALGAMLYELLTGRPPFRAATPLETILQVVSDEPVAPGQLQSKMPRNLETICLKCLHKEPGKRYATAAALAEELGRYLRGEPIAARPVGRLERGWRWCRRNPAVASLLLVVLLLLTTGTTISMLFAFEATSEAGKATREQEKAVASASTALEKADEAKAARAAAEQSRDEAQRHLYRALLGEAEAVRGSRTAGYRDRIWKLLAQAALLDVPERNVLELRQKAVGCLGDFLGRAPTALGEFPFAIQGVALDETGAELAVLMANGQVVCCDTVTGKKQFPQPLTQVGATRPWASFSTARSANGKRTATAKALGVVVTDADRVGEDRTFPMPSTPTLLALSPDGRWLVSSFRTAPPDARPASVNVLKVWDLSSGQALPDVIVPLDWPNRIVFSPDSRSFGCSCLEGAVIYRTADLQQVACIRGVLVYGLSFSPDGQLVLIPSAQEDHVRLWSVATHQDVALLPHAGGPEKVCLSDDGQRIATATAKSVRLWDLGGVKEKRLLAGHESGVPGIAFGPDGTWLASASKDRTTRIWDAASGALRQKLPNVPGLGQGLALSPDGRLVAVSDYVAGTVLIWEKASGRELVAWTEGLGKRVHSVAFSRDGRLFAAGAVPGLRVFRLEVTDAADGSVARLALHPLEQGPPVGADVGHLCFSPDSRLIAWTSNSGRIHVWDIEQRRELPSPGEVFAHIQGLAFHPDGRLVFLDVRRRIVLWDVQAGKPSATFATPGGSKAEGRGSYAIHIGLSPDGRYLAASNVSGHGVNLWDTETGKLLVTLPDEPGVIWCLAWSAKSTSLAVSRSNGSIAVWDLPEVRRQLGELGLQW